MAAYRVLDRAASSRIMRRKFLIPTTTVEASTIAPHWIAVRLRIKCIGAHGCIYGMITFRGNAESGRGLLRPQRRCPYQRRRWHRAPGDTDWPSRALGVVHAKRMLTIRRGGQLILFTSYSRFSRGEVQRYLLAFGSVVETLRDLRSVVRAFPGHGTLLRHCVLPIEPAARQSSLRPDALHRGLADGARSISAAHMTYMLKGIDT